MPGAPTRAPDTARERTTTSCPSAQNALARIRPTCPDPPGITIFITPIYKTHASPESPSPVFHHFQRMPTTPPQIRLRIAKKKLVFSDFVRYNLR